MTQKYFKNPKYEARNSLYCLNCKGNNSSKWDLHNDHPRKFFKVNIFQNIILGHDPFRSRSNTNFGSWPDSGPDPKNNFGHERIPQRVMTQAWVSDPDQWPLTLIKWIFFVKIHKISQKFKKKFRSLWHSQHMSKLVLF